MTKAWMSMVLTVVAMTTVGCAGSATVVRHGSYSGTLMLSGNAHASMDAAQLAMLEHCDGRVQLVRGDDALALSSADPGIAKAEEAGRTVEGERLDYVCVTLASAAR
ncbi:MAG: hypothetical protein U0353_35625 [Sandaracinus sp.]